MPIERNIAILGAGGHAKVVLDALQLVAPGCRVAIYDDATEKAISQLLGLKIQVPIGDLTSLPQDVHVAIGTNSIRRKLGTAVIEAGKNYLCIVHPDAMVSMYSRMGLGGFVGAGAVVAPDAKLGVGIIVNHGAVVDHDCKVGDWTHIAPGAVLGGGVQIGNGCLIGAGAVVLPGLFVADGAIVGAGAVVTRDVCEDLTVIGMPARKKD